MKYLLKLSYLGTHYCGFQVQPNGNTVQAELCRATETLFARPCAVTGCSRTDSGVHAEEYYATVAFEGTSSVPCERIPQALCTYLPEDISVSAAWRTPDDFSVRRAVSGKEYCYRIWNGRQKNPFCADRAFFYPGTIDTARMTEAGKRLIGRHDFASFMASGSDMEDTVRTVTGLRVERDGDFVCIYVSADGFLYNMVRIIVGTLIEVSEGKIAPEEIPDILSARDRMRAGRTAPAGGLFLHKVFISVPEGIV
ncbi:MAG: tRNA pseudouridine(38-40) synthase TruA [Ruminococcus sp.]|nr:tRNA pseudouridine(38-40) synthase TruA [Candidatus Apopatosoma intestinale]